MDLRQLSLLQQSEFASDLSFIIETKRCLNCGNPSPYQSQHSKDYPNSPVPTMEVMNQLALNSNQINLDIDVGGGYTLRDFPFAYLPSIPSGDSSEAALKLVDLECSFEVKLALRSRKSEPRICARCGSTNTPKWRRSPPPMRFLLCNACGLQYSKGINEHTHSISPLEECQVGSSYFRE